MMSLGWGDLGSTVAKAKELLTIFQCLLNARIFPRDSG
jgi:hypothetical protein